jgi:hypothetical protein
MRSRPGPCACAGGLPRSVVDPGRVSAGVSVDSWLRPGPGPEEAIRCADLSLHAQSKVNPLVQGAGEDVAVADSNRTVVGGIQFRAANTLAFARGGTTLCRARTAAARRTMDHYLQLALREYNRSLRASLPSSQWHQLPASLQSRLEERALELELADFAAALLAEAQ